MSDQKSFYSEASQSFVEAAQHKDAASKRQYEKSKEREEKHNENWLKRKVNINEVIDTFAPGSIGRRAGVKILFEGDRYNVIADMAAGYLRIFDTVLGCYVRLDGSPGSDEETHFKIKRREEMWQ